jgi:hypothetical protein
MPSPHRVTVYLPQDKLEELKQKADKQRRSASNLAAAIILEALETPDYVKAIEFLKKLATATDPDDANTILAAHELDIEPDLLFQLRDRLFKKRKQSNDKNQPS